MSGQQLALHLFHAIAPALFLALLLPPLARLLVKSRGLPQSPWAQSAIHFTLGAGVLLGHLVFTGRDGSMAAYAQLVLVLALGQWLMSRGWRK